jgi:hypothetical protein
MSNSKRTQIPFAENGRNFRNYQLCGIGKLFLSTQYVDDLFLYI